MTIEVEIRDMNTSQTVAKGRVQQSSYEVNKLVFWVTSEAAPQAPVQPPQQG